MHPTGDTEEGPLASLSYRPSAKIPATVIIPIIMITILSFTIIITTITFPHPFSKGREPIFLLGRAGPPRKFLNMQVPATCAFPKILVHLVWWGPRVCTFNIPPVLLGIRITHVLSHQIGNP